MFTGIIQEIGQILEVKTEAQGLVRLRVASAMSSSLKVDQSVSHNGVCLTITALGDGWHEVQAIAETLAKTTIGNWKPGTRVNLERALRLGDALDGHLVQGHVDARGHCVGRKELPGSWEFDVSYPESFAALLIEKGSIALNGISLTVFGLESNRFRVAIIPYTFTHTTMADLQEGDELNLEFDLLGKYITRSRALEGDGLH